MEEKKKVWKPNNCGAENHYIFRLTASRIHQCTLCDHPPVPLCRLPSHHLVDYRAQEVLDLVSPHGPTVPQVHQLTHWQQCVPDILIVSLFVSTRCTRQWLTSSFKHDLKSGSTFNSPALHTTMDWTTNTTPQEDKAPAQIPVDPAWGGIHSKFTKHISQNQDNFLSTTGGQAKIKGTYPDR